MRGFGDQTFLRTGDLGFIKNGELIITGRLKDVIIINGRNFYAEDIEFTIRDIHPALQSDSGAVFSVEMDGVERLVIVYEVKREYRNSNVDEVARVIRRAIAERHELAVHEVVLIKPLSLPRTTSNKVQRSACKANYLSGTLIRIGSKKGEVPDEKASQVISVSVEPRTPIEASLCFIWAEVLGIEKVGVNDNFFELGGTSLIATQIASRVEDFFHVELPLSILFETPTVANLASLIEKKELQEKLNISGPILRVDHSLPTPCSFAQERMWFLYQLDPTSSAYNLPLAVHLIGPLDVGVMRTSFYKILDRHDSLRTSFIQVEDQPFQVVHPLRPDFIEDIYEFIDLIDEPVDKREELAKQFVSDEARKPFDLSAGIPIRLKLIRKAESEHILIINLHHIIGDAWSINQLVREFLIHYNGLTSGTPVSLPELPVQYIDYSAWQRQYFSNGALKKDISYWRHQLREVPVLELPADHPRPDVQTYHGAVEILEIDKDLLEKLKRLSRKNEVTLFMVLLAGFAILLHRYTGMEDLAIGVPVANRNRLETEQLIGVLVNTIVMRLKLDGDPTFKQLLQMVRRTSLEAYDHQELPFSKLISELRPVRDTGHSPITQVLFNLIDVQTPPLNLNGLEIETMQIDRKGAQFDLTLSVTDISTEHSIAIEYNTDLFEKATIVRMMDHFVHLLHEIVGDDLHSVSQYSMLSEAERYQLLVGWNATSQKFPVDACIPDLIEAQVVRTPDAIAVTYGNQSLTYKELNNRANRLAHGLRNIGTKPGKLVGIYLNRSPEILVAILAVLKAGGAYVPLDPMYPASRLAYMIEDSQVGLLIKHSELGEALPLDDIVTVDIDDDLSFMPEDCSDNPIRLLKSSDLAYVIYTSGSTGKPKGVQITQQAVVNFLLSMLNEPGIDQKDTLLAVTTISFDIAVLELMLPLVAGARVVIADREITFDGERLARLIDEQGVTMLQATPVTWELMLASGWQGTNGLKMLCGGESLRKELAQELLSKGSELWNMFGPTETTIWSSIDRVESGDEDITIGRPIANTEMYILDSHLQPVPVGIPGMLYIGGTGLSPGYLNLPGLTDERFIQHPFRSYSDQRVYQTGDLAKYLPDGRIQWLGRSDHQVKIRGFRIELGEVEAVLNEHPTVKRAVVSTHQMDKINTSLVAYIIPDGELQPDPSELKSFLKEKLPEYMVPVAYVSMDSFPLTPNGKVNFKALPAPQLIAESVSIPPRNSTERELLKVWEQVLNVHPIGIRNNFFDLGGHSLLAIRLLNRVEDVFGIRLPIAAIFQSPTIEEMALVLIGKVQPPDWTVLVPINKRGSQRPVYCVHGAGGGILGYAALAKALGDDQPFYGLQAKGVDGKEEPHHRIEEMAAFYIEQIQRLQPTGPYDLAGYSFGGFVAYEMACQLRDQGHQVGLLAMLDTYALTRKDALRLLWQPKNFIKFLMNLPAWIRDEIILFFVRNSKTRFIPERKQVLDAHIEALEHYKLRKYDGKVSLFRVKTFSLLRSFDPNYGWGELATGGVNHYIISGSHFNMLEEPFVEKLAEQLKKSLQIERAGLKC